MNNWSLPEIASKFENNESFHLYLYTPLCGTCQVSGKMLTVVTHLIPNLHIGKCDLNYLPEKAREWSIESVPCLLTVCEGQIVEKIYAFRSVEYLLDKLKTSP